MNIGFFAFSQNRSEFWTKLTVVKTLNPKWSVGADIQYRSQANYQISDNRNFFENDLSRALRLWVFYKLSPKWTITAAPIAYFSNVEINKQLHLAAVNELRSAWGITNSLRFLNVKNKNRFLYENRFIDWNKQNAYFQHRYRLQNAFAIPITKMGENSGINLFLMNEFFVKTQKNITTFDQNRVFAALQLRFKGIELSSGYQHVFQQGSSANFQRKIWLTTLNIAIP